MTSAEVIDEIYKQLNVSPLKTAINGGIYKLQRPKDSVKEDVVINCLGMDGEQLQKGMVNVNVFVPDIPVNINGVQQKQPNFSRLKVLSTLAISEATGRKSGYWFDKDQDRIFKDDNSEQHFSNIRIRFYAINF
jgi:hypothetical protein